MNDPTQPLVTLRTAPFAATAAVLAVVAALGGCSTQNLSGIGGDTTFKCKAPEGVQCQSVSGNYANARAGNLPSQRPQGDAGQGASGAGSSMSLVEAASRAGAASVTAMTATAAAPPRASATAFASRSAVAAPLGAIRSDPTVIRIWVAPWEDADGDLMDQTYVYLPIDSGRWLIEHNQRRIQREFAPVRAPATALAPSRPAAPREVREDDANDPDSAAAMAAGIAKLRSPEKRDVNAPAGAQ